MSDDETRDDPPEIDLGEAVPAEEPDELTRLVEEMTGEADMTLDPGPEPAAPKPAGSPDVGGQNPFRFTSFEDGTVVDPNQAQAFADDLIGVTGTHPDQVAEEVAMAAENLKRAAERDAEFAEGQLPDSVIPELAERVVEPGLSGPDDAARRQDADDGIVDPWDQTPMRDDRSGSDEDPPRPSGEETGGERPMILSPGILGAILVLAVAIGGTIWFLGQGDDGPTAESASTTVAESGDTTPGRSEPAEAGAETWVATDAPEWEQFDEFDEIVREREADGIVAGDVMDATSIVSAYVTSDTKSAEVGIEFAGDAQAAQAHERVDLSGGVGWITADGRYLDILFYDDGTYKISDKPSEWTIEALWERPDKLVFFVDGVGVVPGEAVAVSLFLDVFAGVNLQTVEIPTG